MTVSVRRVGTVLVAALIATSVVAISGSAGAAGETAPGAPNSGVAMPSNAGAIVSWKAPASDGGSPITGYVVTPYLGAVALKARVFNSPAKLEGVGGLKNGKLYRFTIKARNAIGTSPPSPRTSAIVVGAPRKPGRPTVVRVKSGVLRITFAIPANNGAKITWYSGSCVAADHKSAANLGGTGSPITRPNLSPGTVYTCTVKAANSRGRSPRSAPSLPVKA